MQREITKINNRLADQIKEVEARIADIRKTVDPTIASANENIAKYTHKQAVQTRILMYALMNLRIKLMDYSQL